MNATDFLNTARQVIGNDPEKRLSAKVKKAIADPECMIDIHAHIFDRKCLSIGYVLLRMLKSKLQDFLGLESLGEDGLLAKTETEIYKKIETEGSGSAEDWKQLEAELETASELTETVELFGLNIREAIKVLKKGSMAEVLDYYISNFSVIQLPDYKNKPFINGVLMMDLATGWNMKPDKTLSMQISEIKKIMSEKPILPFLAVDPRRADLTDPNENIYDLFLKAFSDPNTPYFGVKCYPSLGYLPSDVRLDPIFEICAEKNIPVLTHCGGETVSTFEKKIEVKDQNGIREFTIPGNSRVERAKFLNDPEAWIPVLTKHPNLKLNLAHFGGDDCWKNHGETNHGNYRVNKIVEMMKNPQWKVYTDFSFNVIDKELFKTFKAELETNTDIQNKVMFGTDYWVVLPAGDLLTMQGEFLEELSDHQNRLLNKAPLNFMLATN